MIEVVDRALSLMPPWTWLMANGYKTIENRKRFKSFRGRVFIHASMNWDSESFYNFKRMDEPFRRARSLSACPFPSDMPSIPNQYQFGGIVGIMTIVDCVEESDNPWFFGKYGFVCKDARPLPFVPCKGALGFWKVPANILAQINLEG